MVTHFRDRTTPAKQCHDGTDNDSTSTLVPAGDLAPNGGSPQSEPEPADYSQAELPADEPSNPPANPRFEIPDGARVLAVTVAAPAALAHFRLEQHRDWDYLAGLSAEDCSLSDAPTELLVLYEQARPLEEDVRLRTLWLAQQTVIRAGTQADMQYQPYDPRLTGGPMHTQLPGYLNAAQNGPHPMPPRDMIFGRQYISVQACLSAGLVEGQDWIVEGIAPQDILICGPALVLEEMLHGRTIALRDEDLFRRRHRRRPVQGFRRMFDGARAMPAEDVIPEYDEGLDYDGD